MKQKNFFHTMKKTFKSGDIISYQTMIQLSGIVNNPEKIQYYFKQMEDDGCKLSAGTHFIVIKAFGDNNLIDKAEEVLSHLTQKLKFRPISNIYIYLMSKYFNIGNYLRVLQLNKEMLSYKWNRTKDSHLLEGKAYNALRKAGTLPDEFRVHKKVAEVKEDTSALEFLNKKKKAETEEQITRDSTTQITALKEEKRKDKREKKKKRARASKPKKR